MELSIFSQDKTVLGSFDLIEINQKNSKQVIGWSCHLMSGSPWRVLGEYDSEEIALSVLDELRAREDALRSQSMISNVFVMPAANGEEVK